MDEPLAVVFFATPDVISGLFALANFDRADLDGVITPIGSGCASMVKDPCWEARAAKPRCVLGVFDVSLGPRCRQTK